MRTLINRNGDILANCSLKDCSLDHHISVCGVQDPYFANLFAAAPDLLEACKGLTTTFFNCEWDTNQEENDAHDVLENALAAIARAEGGKL